MPNYRSPFLVEVHKPRTLPVVVHNSVHIGILAVSCLSSCLLELRPRWSEVSTESDGVAVAVTWLAHV